jgi:methylated-DNA-[protein]-cysteine S-methyltransferase
MESPIGALRLVGSQDALHGLYMQSDRHAAIEDLALERTRLPFAAVIEQLEEYFFGRRQEFDLSLELHGSPFQKTVWKALQQISFGQTMSYGELAKRIGQPNASRAVGLANGRNPISIIVPCHRVIGANGSLTGYGGGIERKRYLLELEGAPGRLL